MIVTLFATSATAAICLLVGFLLATVYAITVVNTGAVASRVTLHGYGSESRLGTISSGETFTEHLWFGSDGMLCIPYDQDGTTYTDTLEGYTTSSMGGYCTYDLGTHTVMDGGMR